MPKHDGALRALGANPSVRYIASWIAAGAAMVLVLLAPALWNGWPVIYPDTGGYLARPLTGTLGLGRSAFYGAFLLAGLPLEFWPNVIIQAALTSWLVVLILRTHGLGRRPLLAVAIVLLLAIATSLPWFVSLLMPDALFPIAVLALHLLIFRANTLTRHERIGLCAVVVFAIVSHMAMVGLAAGMIAALWFLRWFARLTQPRLWIATLAVASGLFLAPLSNALITGHFIFTPGGPSFLFGRLIEDGIVTRYLDEKCPEPALHICAYRNGISRDTDDWLWKNDSPFWKLGGWQGYEEEERRIIWATLARYPITHMMTALRAATLQFSLFTTDFSNEPGDNAPTLGIFKDYAPQLLPNLRAARLEAAPFDADPLNFVHVPVAIISLVVVIVAVVWRRRLHVASETTALSASVLLALVLNAVICGVFSHPDDRYQSRLIPLATLATAVLLLRARAAARPPSVRFQG